MINQVRKFYDNYLEKLAVKNNRHSWVLYSLDRFIPKDTTVLDIGCGTGITSKHLARDGRSVIAVDLSPKLIEYAKEHNNHEGVSYMSGDICEIEFSEKFDAIVMVDVLEHILSESIPALFNVLSSVSHETTRIYLNIPSPDVIKFLQKEKPDLLQIVDNAIETEDILKRFDGVGFAPAYFQFYWQQYVEYLFVTKKEFNKTMSKMFK